MNLRKSFMFIAYLLLQSSTILSNLDIKKFRNTNLYYFIVRIWQSQIKYYRQFHLWQLIFFKSIALYNYMGCTPPEKRQKSIPAINVFPKKTTNSSPKSSQNSKNSTKANQNNLLPVPIPKLPSNQSLKNKNKKWTSSEGNLNKYASFGNTQRFNYQHQDSPVKPIEKQVIRIMSPKQKTKVVNKASEKQQLGKLTSIHSLDIISKIKIPKENASKPQKKEADKNKKNSSKVEEVNITFNNNDFMVAQSKASGSFGRSKRWKEQALLNQLKSINNQNFKQIAINSRNYN